MLWRPDPESTTTSTTALDTTTDEPDDVRLSRLAAAGDRAAAGEFLTRNMRLLRSMSRRIASDVLDPEDLLSEALTTLLDRWARGTGPDRNVLAYVISSMRNRVIDELRAPRRLDRPLDLQSELPDTHGDPYDSIDLYRERVLLRKALDRIPPEQKRVLLATVVEGLRPRQLEVEFDRPAAAISSLANRAKASLRGAVELAQLADRARTAQRPSA